MSAPVGKARAVDRRHATAELHWVVPCFDQIDEDKIRDHLERGHFFWLDLTAPSSEEIQRLGEMLGFHPLAMEDTESFNQRPKLDDYGDHVFLVFYGARTHVPEDPEPLREVHLFISGRYVISIHREPLPALDDQRVRLDGRLLHSEQFLIYRVLDALTDSFFPLLAAMDEEIDEIEDGIIESADPADLARIFRLKRQLVEMRKVVTPQRDLFIRSIDEIAQLPGLQLDERDYFRDVYDHLIRVSDLIDSYRDLLSGATDLYLSTVGNRQNEVMKQLAIVGTIFLPLAFITGFFGENFAWLVRHINSAVYFWVLGVGSMVVTCIGLLFFFKRKGWM